MKVRITFEVDWPEGKDAGAASREVARKLDDCVQRNWFRQPVGLVAIEHETSFFSSVELVPTKARVADEIPF